MPEREVRSDADRPPAVVHQLSRDVVDRRDVVGVDRVAQAEAVGEERRPEQDGVIVEGGQRPDPGAQVGGREHGVEADDAPA